MSGLTLRTRSYKIPLESIEEGWNTQTLARSQKKAASGSLYVTSIAAFGRLWYLGEMLWCPPIILSGAVAKSSTCNLNPSINVANTRQDGLVLSALKCNNIFCCTLQYHYLSIICMANKHQKKAAAQSRATRHEPKQISPLPHQGNIAVRHKLDKVFQIHIIHAFSTIFTILVRQVRPLKPRQQCTITAMIVCVVTTASLSWVPNSCQDHQFWYLMVIVFNQISDHQILKL